MKTEKKGTMVRLAFAASVALIACVLGSAALPAGAQSPAPPAVTLPPATTSALTAMSAVSPASQTAAKTPAPPHSRQIAHAKPMTLQDFAQAQRQKGVPWPDPPPVSGH